MKCKTVLFGIGLLFLTFNLQGQQQKIGVMLHRITITKSDAEMSMKAALEIYTSPPKSKAAYSKEENEYITLINNLLKQNFKAANIKTKVLTFTDLTHEERLTEQNFFTKMLHDYSMSLAAHSVKDMFKSEKKRKAAFKSDKTVGPLANIFADKLDSDILVFFVIGIAQKQAITISAYVVNGNSGKLITTASKTKTGKTLFKEGKEKSTLKTVNRLIHSLVQKLAKVYEEEGK